MFLLASSCNESCNIHLLKPIYLLIYLFIGLAPRKKGDGGAAPRKKGGRGAARMPKGWGEEGKQLMVYLDQDGRNIIGPDVNEYKTAVGCLARNGMRLPLHYPSFKFIPEHFKKGAWMEIQASSKSGRILIVINGYLFI